LADGYRGEVIQCKCRLWSHIPGFSDAEFYIVLSIIRRTGS